MKKKMLRIFIIFSILFFSKPSTSFCYSNVQQTMRHDISPFDITYNRIALLLRELDVQKTIEPDNISPVILKN